MNDIPKGPGFLPTFLYYFLGTTLVATLLAVKALGTEFNLVGANQLGLLIGLLGGGLGAYFNRSVTLEIPFKSKKAFFKTLNQALADMGYGSISDLKEEVIVYQRPPLRQLFSGKIFVQISGGVATLSSRSIHINRLKQRLK